MYIRKVKKSESKSQLAVGDVTAPVGLCISVKLKNLKANHNRAARVGFLYWVVYIRKVKKSESKSQLIFVTLVISLGLCISVKLKNLKANHNVITIHQRLKIGCVYP